MGLGDASRNDQRESKIGNDRALGQGYFREWGEGLTPPMLSVETSTAYPFLIDTCSWTQEERSPKPGERGESGDENEPEVPNAELPDIPVQTPEGRNALTDGTAEIRARAEFTKTMEHCPPKL
jgi:hypothetical protein